MAQLAATGISVRPMVVITVPVTTGGKNRMILANSGVISRPISEAAITEPKTAWIPPPPWTIATMVATPANETPWTSGQLGAEERDADGLQDGGQAADEQAGGDQQADVLRGHARPPRR